MTSVANTFGAWDKLMQERKPLGTKLRIHGADTCDVSGGVTASPADGSPAKPLAAAPPPGHEIKLAIIDVVAALAVGIFRTCEIQAQCFGRAL